MASTDEEKGQTRTLQLVRDADPAARGTWPTWCSNQYRMNPWKSTEEGRDGGRNTHLEHWVRVSISVYCQQSSRTLGRRTLCILRLKIWHRVLLLLEERHEVTLRMSTVRGTFYSRHRKWPETEMCNGCGSSECKGYRSKRAELCTCATKMTSTCKDLRSCRQRQRAHHCVRIRIANEHSVREVFTLVLGEMVRGE